MTRLAKFFIICAAVCVLGIIMTFAGYAAGGWENMSKVAEKHDWINVGPEGTETNIITVGEFKSIEAEGALDIAVIAPGADLDESDYPDFLQDIYSEGVAGTVAINWGDGSEPPEVNNENGVLKIKGSSDAVGQGVVNLNGADMIPDVVVFCAAEKLESINISDTLGDVAVEGLTAKRITVDTDSGDTNISYVSGDELTVNVNSGDIELDADVIEKQTLTANSGDIEITEGTGEINAAVNSGSIGFESTLPQKEFELSMKTKSGDLSLNDSWLEVTEFATGNGPNRLNFKTDSGEISVAFRAE